MDRKQIAEKLMHKVPAEARQDHERLAEMILAGQSRNSILDSEEADHWPETYSWLHTVLPDADKAMGQCACGASVGIDVNITECLSCRTKRETHTSLLCDAFGRPPTEAELKASYDYADSVAELDD